MEQALTVSLIFLVSVIFYFASRSQRFPPGPPGLPLLGVTRNHPKLEWWKTYAEWGRRYSPKDGIIFFHVLGRQIIVLNTRKAAEDLLVRRSAIYSDRPFPVMGAKLLNREKSIFASPYNERLKMYRKLLHQEMNPVAAVKHWEILEQHARKFVANVDSDPENLLYHLRGNASAVALDIAYGYKVKSSDDYFVLLEEETVRIASLALAPGKWLVDSLPWLQHLPDFVPGTGFKRQANEWSKTLMRQLQEPFEWVKEQMEKGSWNPSFTSHLLETPDGRYSREDFEERVMWAAGAIYQAGADTTVASVTAFLFNMIMHPDIQARAHAEVDTLILKEQRLPGIRDRDSMPYLGAILKEVLRWAPPAPSGLFHRTAAVDDYRGFFIPKKTVIIGNIWAILHDEDDYPDPMKFDPERFLEKDGSPAQPNPLDIVFGFGRRVCPGQYIAEGSVFMQMVTFLAFLEIKKAVTPDGHVLEPKTEFTTGVISHVKPFPYQIQRRSTSAAARLDIQINE